MEMESYIYLGGTIILLALFAQRSINLCAKINKPKEIYSTVQKAQNKTRIGQWSVKGKFNGGL